jgi:ATP-binding cassette, subfamily B (MDR/TAP), member 1
VLIEKLRLRTFATLLHQEIGWFDRKENNSGRLSKLLENDAAAIQTVSVN